MAKFLSDEQIAALVPDSEKVLGKSYLCKCGHEHVHRPPFSMEKMIEDAAQRIADEIDRDILKAMLRRR